MSRKEKIKTEQRRAELRRKGIPTIYQIQDMLFKRRKTKKSSTHFKPPKRGKNRKKKTHFPRNLRWQETDEEAMYCTSYKCELSFDYDKYWCPFHGDYHCPYVYDYDDIDSDYYYESDFEDYGLHRDYYYDNGVRVYHWDDYRLPRDYWNDSD